MRYVKYGLGVVTAMALAFSPLYEFAFHTQRSNLDMLFNLGRIHTGSALFAVLSIWGIVEALVLIVHVFKDATGRNAHASHDETHNPNGLARSRRQEVHDAVNASDGFGVIAYPIAFAIIVEAISSDVTYYVHPTGWVWLLLALGIGLVVLDAIGALSERPK